MRGSAVSHRFIGASPGSWVMEGGKRALTPLYTYSCVGGEGEKTTVPLLRRLGCFLLHKALSLPHRHKRQRKGFKLKALKAKQDGWARAQRKGEQH